MKLFFLIILLWLQTGLSQPNGTKQVKMPKLLTMQFAGNVGLASVGVTGRFLHDRIMLGIGYGYLPESVNGAEVHTITVKPGYLLRIREISEKTKLAFYSGIGLIYGITKNTYLEYPDHYPDGYYKTNALHATPYAGIGVSFNYRSTAEKKKWAGLYCEVGTVDDYLYNIAIGRSEYKSNIWNLALGVFVEVN